MSALQGEAEARKIACQSLLGRAWESRSADRCGAINEKVRKRFEAAWHAGKPVAIESCLPVRPGTSHVATLEELVVVELEMLWRAANEAKAPDRAKLEPPRIENYLQRFPALDQPDIVRRLLKQEFQVRQYFDPDVAADEYHERFPGLKLGSSIVPSEILTTTFNFSPMAKEQAAGCDRAARFGQNLPGYEILDELGRGGMGIVYRARDLKRGQIVALKTLHGIDAAAIYRFKKEFRALANVTHPNLVCLHELISDGQLWFFTMDLVEGVDFLTHVRSEPGMLSAAQLGRLREALKQLAEGVVALHRAGKLHRDIKPGNVLVTRSGRVVLLDFGLTAELEGVGQHESSEAHVVGTAAYMSPEQGAALPVSTATDWYSVGVMLYQALTGRLPFRGGLLQVLRQKEQFEPPAPRSLFAEIPEDLDALCRDLLKRDPRARPQGCDVLNRLGGAGHPTEAVAMRQDSAIPLIGREQHLAMLTAAFSALKHGRTTTVYIQGKSGAGKTALAQHFLDQLCEGDEVLVLSGKCHEQESVPYKAFDNLIDALSRHLGRLPRLEVQALLPRDVLPLVRVFPVLRQVQAIADATQRASAIHDPQEVRRRAFASLRELLARLGDRKLLVLFIDDLQWGDVDSAALLTELLRSPEPPRFLLLGCYRSEDAAVSPFLRELQLNSSAPDESLTRIDMVVEALTFDQVRNLALMLFGRVDAETSARAEAVARESGGNPFFVHELVQYLADGARDAESWSRCGDISLNQVLWARVQRLAPEAQQLLWTVVVAGRPLGRGDACNAAGVASADFAVVADLRSQRLVRSTGLAGGEMLAPYHDRVREIIGAHLQPDRRRDLHERLARTLERTNQADPEFLAHHFQGAGDRDKAGSYYAVAAAQAAEALAFDRAATLYRLAIDLRTVSGPEACRLWTRLGDALANAARGTEAAKAYLMARNFATDRDTTLKLQQRAAMQFLISGHVDQGLEIVRDALKAVGLRLPKTPRRAFWSLALRRAQLRCRGLRFRARRPDQLPPADLARIDTCWSVAVGLAVVDPILGAYFQSRGLLLALQAGEPSRIVRSLAVEAAHVSTGGGFSQRRTARLVQAAEALAETVTEPYTRGMICASKGMTAYLEGHWQTAQHFCDQAATIFREQCRGVAWELDTVSTFGLWSLSYLGEIAEMSRRRPALLKEARERGDLYAVTNLSTYIMAFVRLAADEPTVAQHELTQAMGSWSQQGFHVQHHNALLAQILIQLYEGKGTDAWKTISERWPAYKRSLLLGIQQTRVEVYQLRARSALAAANQAADPKPFLRAAEDDARRLQREKMPYAHALARFIQANVTAARGDIDDAICLFKDAVTRLEAVDMRLVANAARRRLGELLCGTEGQNLVAEADAWMQHQKIQDPSRMTAMYCPCITVRR